MIIHEQVFNLNKRLHKNTKSPRIYTNVFSKLSHIIGYTSNYMSLPIFIIVRLYYSFIKICTYCTVLYKLKISNNNKIQNFHEPFILFLKWKY